MGIAEDIGRLETELRELIIKYEQYFCGIEKREPLRKLELVDRLVKRYQNVSIPNTMHRFKYESLVSTLSVHRQKWTRITRLIEEGKYVRDRSRMARSGQPGQDRSSPPSPAASEFQLERLYQEYRDARLACNLPVERLTPEKIALAIEQKMPAIREKYQCNDVEFFVVIENGRPRLKARQKNG